MKKKKKKNIIYRGREIREEDEVVGTVFENNEARKPITDAYQIKSIIILLSSEVCGYILAFVHKNMGSNQPQELDTDKSNKIIWYNQ